jgi:hypothetical protein
MHDRQVFSKLLGVVAPWEVEHVDLRLEEGEVHINQFISMMTITAII